MSSTAPVDLLSASSVLHGTAATRRDPQVGRPCPRCRRVATGGAPDSDLCGSCLDRAVLIDEIDLDARRGYAVATWRFVYSGFVHVTEHELEFQPAEPDVGIMGAGHNVYGDAPRDVLDAVADAADLRRRDRDEADYEDAMERRAGRDAEPWDRDDDRWSDLDAAEAV